MTLRLFDNIGRTLAARLRSKTKNMFITVLKEKHPNTTNSGVSHIFAPLWTIFFKVFAVIYRFLDIFYSTVWEADLNGLQLQSEQTVKTKFLRI